ncbi:MAG: hypothetical protein EPO24_03060, partial [Bacteroidetes bacterium]
MSFSIPIISYYHFKKGSKKEYITKFVITLVICISNSSVALAQQALPVVRVELPKADSRILSTMKAQQEEGKVITLSPPAAQISQSTLINIVHPYSPDNTRNLTANYFYANLQKRMFANETHLDIEALFLDQVSENTVSFILDPYWGRVIYAQKNGTWIRSYGDHPADFKFWEPRGFSIDLTDTLFVADADRRTIIRLVYNRTDGKIYHNYAFELSGLMHPVDVAIDLQGSLSNPQNPANDHIWIADDFEGKLVDLHRDGTVAQTILYYQVGTAQYRLNRPSKVQTQDNNKIAFIDGERNAFVVGSRPSPSITTMASNVYCTVFEAPLKLTCIGLDVNNEWWVGDEVQRQYHHFASSGEYICSYTAGNTPPGQFASPVSVSKAPYLWQNGQVYRSLYVYTSDLWGDNTGMRAFLPGSDVVSIEETGGSACERKFRILLTNKSYVKGQVVLNTDPSNVIASYNYGVKEAGWQTVSIEKLLLGSESYKLQIMFMPYYDDQYSNYVLGYSYSQGWKTKEKYFYHTAGNFGAGIKPVPSTKTCFSGEYGTWKVSTYCTGNFTYTWYKNDAHGSNNWTLWGQENSTSAYIGFNAYPNEFELKCVVKNNVPGGQTYTADYMNCAPPPPPPPSATSSPR